MGFLDLADRSWPVLDKVMGAHVILYRATNGLVGKRFPGVPDMLLLDHIGAKTGKRRTSALVYIEDGENLVLIASKGGHPSHPAWFHNLNAHPDVRVQVGRERRAVRARVASDKERDRLWPKAVEAYSGYGTYQQRTDRKIPVVILEPREA
ncbi:MAG: nitroreductase family deazaflavin-dependent oxidoreductase [Actinomycetota bacterium]